MHSKISMCVILCGLWCATGFGQARSDPQSPIAPAGSPSVVDIDSYCQTLLPGDPHAEPLQKACITSLQTARSLPNYLCDMEVVKWTASGVYAGISSRWQVLQKVTAHARFVDGVDTYEDLKIDGRRSANLSSLRYGNWSGSELEVKLLAVFKPGNHPGIQFRRETRIGKINAYEFRYAVSQENNSVWRWVWAGGTYNPAYEGTIAISKLDGHVLKLVLQSVEGLPKEVPVVSSVNTTDFKFVEFEDGKGFMLPSHVLVDTAMRLHSELPSRQEINFKDCRKFGATSRIVPDPAN